jgi:hypothetical protein
MARLGAPYSLCFFKEVRKHLYQTTNSTGSLNCLTNTIRHCLVPDNPWSGHYGSNSFWLSSCSLKKNFYVATNTAQNIGFVCLTGFLIYELKTKLIGIKDPFSGTLLLVPM